MLARFQARWIPFRNSRDPASLAVLGALALASGLLALFLVLGPKPWEPSLLKRLAAGKPLKLDHFIQIGLWWGALASFGHRPMVVPAPRPALPRPHPALLAGRPLDAPLRLRRHAPRRLAQAGAPRPQPLE